jgi:uncharacterized membrane protein YhaH (DUF805 family)
MDLFSSPIGRLAFLGRHVLGLALVVIGRMGLIVAAERESLVFITLSAAVVMSGTAYFAIYGILPRLASIGLSRWYALVFLVPVVNFFFLLFLFFCQKGWLIKRAEVS